MPFTLAAPSHSELLIRKSRFIGCVQPMTDRAGAIMAVEALRAEHPGATHVCWALLAGGHSAAVDDGEPSGTAGRPMLDVLRHQNLDGVLATVVRYFGGVKLGAGGLVRAYADTVARALQGATKVPIVAMHSAQCRVPYALEGVFRRELARTGASLDSMRRDERLEIAFSLPADRLPALVARMNDLSHGQVFWLHNGD